MRDSTARCPDGSVRGISAFFVYPDASDGKAESFGFFFGKECLLEIKAVRSEI
jgi:hypothetical protein